MSRLSIVALLIASLPAGAAAQAISITADVDGRDPDDGSVHPHEKAINRVECGLDGGTGVTLSLHLVGVDSTQSILDFWRGTSCFELARRTSTTDTSCTWLGSGPADTISSRTTIDLDVVITDLVSCTADREGTETIWVLATDREESAMDVGTNYGSFQIGVDTQRPNPPLEVMKEDGQGRVGAGWDLPESNDTLQEVRLYTTPCTCVMGPLMDGGTDGGMDAGATDAGMDAGADAAAGTDAGPGTDAGGGGGDGGGCAFVNGQVAPGTGYKELAATATQGLADVGGSVGDMYQVGVTTVDDAGNESVMAVASSCARLIDASGFCDAVDGGCPSGCATAAPGGDAGGLFGLLALGPLLLAARRRWRR